MNVEDTEIEQGGVMRCCLATIAREYLTDFKPVQIGDTSTCPHCKTKFILVEPATAKAVGTAFYDLTKPIWKPEWQLTKELI